VHRAELRDGIDGTVVANPDFTGHDAGDTSIVDGTGKTWTLAGDAYLGGSVTDDATEIVVAFTGLTRWISGDGEAWELAHFPFDITFGGERATVTEVAGTSSPQTFTVTRSVDGVVKPQQGGTAVHVANPLRTAL
jgi:hypothetical protein